MKSKGQTWVAGHFKGHFRGYRENIRGENSSKAGKQRKFGGKTEMFNSGLNFNFAVWNGM